MDNLTTQKRGGWLVVDYLIVCIYKSGIKDTLWSNGVVS